MSVMLPGDFSKSLEPIGGVWFGDGYKMKKEQFPEVFKVSSMSRAFVEDVLASGIGLMQEVGAGDATPIDKSSQGFVARYTAMDYRLGLIISQNLIDDGIDLDQLERKTKMLGNSARKTKETLAFNVLNRHATSGYVGGDGVVLCSTAHPTKSGNQSNRLATDAALSEASLEQMHLEIGSIKDDAGLRIDLKARKLVIPRALVFEAERILHSTSRVGVADNDVNALRNLGLVPEGVVASDYLSSSTAYFLLTDEELNGLRFLERKAPMLTADKDFLTDNNMFKVHMRCALGWSDWRCIFGTTGV